MQQKTQKNLAVHVRERRRAKKAMSRRRPCTRSVPEPFGATPPDQTLLRYLAELGAVPLDLAARLTGYSEDLIREMFDEGMALGWIRQSGFPMEPNPWALLL